MLRNLLYKTKIPHINAPSSNPEILNPENPLKAEGVANRWVIQCNAGRAGATIDLKDAL